MQNTETTTNQTRPNNTQSSTQITSQLTSKKKMLWVLVILVVLLSGSTGVFAYKYYELKQKVDNQQLAPLPSPQLDVSNPTSAPSPSSLDEKPPIDCVLWFDGCNNCRVINGKINSCTEKLCMEYEEARCLSHEK